MCNHYFEAIVAGIVTAVLAGFFGLGSLHTAGLSAPPATQERR